MWSNVVFWGDFPIMVKQFKLSNRVLFYYFCSVSWHFFPFLFLFSSIHAYVCSFVAGLSFLWFPFPCGSLLFHCLSLIPYCPSVVSSSLLQVPLCFFLLFLTILLFIIFFGVETSKRVKGITPSSRVVLGQVFSPAIKLEYLNYPWFPPTPHV